MKNVSSAISVPAPQHQSVSCDRCATQPPGRYTTLPPSPALLVVARRLRSTWLSWPHPLSTFNYLDDIRSSTSLRRS
eukprot:6207549-Pleurochrysis_carterae.AAC.1